MVRMADVHSLEERATLCPKVALQPTARPATRKKRHIHGRRSAPTRRSRPTFTDQEALQFHARAGPASSRSSPTKPMATQRDLSLAYSPGVAVPVLRDRREPEHAPTTTPPRATWSPSSPTAPRSSASAISARSPSKPVMEGKAVLFKRFADIDAIDIEVDTEDADEFINCVRYLGPTFGGINLEDIKAPECFIIEQRCAS